MPLRRFQPSFKLKALYPLLLALFFWTEPLCASESLPLEFNTISLGEGSDAVLIIGGIQGDEPGGFSAATLLATAYEITKGSLVVVPNLNFPSIIRRSRGLHGDMNRKFASLDANDPEFGTVRKVQELIRRPEVRLVLNLHDGSGYYYPEFQDKLRNPARWGQSVIIDQENLEDKVFMSSLAREAAQAASAANAFLMDSGHAIHVRNTNTAAGDREMEKSLSYYAVRQNKAAFGIEASKEFPVALRVYYHLLLVEEFLKMAGVEFSRGFELTPAGVEATLVANLGVAFAGNRIFLPLDDVRPAINYLPLPKGSASSAITSKPIMAVLPCQANNGKLCVHYGNRTITTIKPDWHEVDHGLESLDITVDGAKKTIGFGQIVDVKHKMEVKSIPGYRLNAIGVDKGLADESALPLFRKDFKERFSIDRAGRIYRMEIYKDKKFAGMFLVRFGASVQETKAESLLPDAKGRESELGY